MSIDLMQGSEIMISILKKTRLVTYKTPALNGNKECIFEVSKINIVGPKKLSECSVIFPSNKVKMYLARLKKRATMLTVRIELATTVNAMKP